MLTLYHSTSVAAASLIEAHGFADSDFAGIASGVCVSDRPLDDGDAASHSSEACFAIDVPATAGSLDEFLIETDAAPDDPPPVDDPRALSVYREWLIPAATLNSWPRRRYYDDVQFVRDPTSRRRRLRKGI